MKTIELKAIYREQLGKNEVKKIRKNGMIPAVVYGRQTKPVAIQMNAKEFEQIIHTGAGGNVLIGLKVSGAQSLDERVIIKEIQQDPVTEKIDHVDFNVVSLTEEIEIQVRLVLKGEAPGAKEGGILDVVHHEIEVRCLPTNMPEKLEADISALQIGQAVHVSDILFPEGVVCMLSPDEVVVAVHAPKAEETKAEEETAQEPEVIAKGKEEAAAEGEAPAASAEPKKEKAE